MRLGAIILAGGRSKRMGQPKEWLAHFHTTLLGHLADTMTRCCERVVVVARDAAQPLPPLPPGTLRAHDAEAGLGPLAGIVAGMHRLQGEGFAADDAAFVVACDHAMVTEGIVVLLASFLQPAHDAVVPRHEGFVQPLCAVYRLRVLPIAERLLATADNGPRSLVAAIAAFHPSPAGLMAVDPRLSMLRDIDTPDDYDDLLRGS